MDLMSWADRLSKETSDINEHLPTLQKLASECSVVVEMGVRTGRSTVALLAGTQGVVHSWDTQRLVEHEDTLRRIEELAGDRWVFHLGDSRTADIPECDLLFIDTKHCGEHLAEELEMLNDRSRRWIVLHDVESFGWIGEGNQRGLLAALGRFLMETEDWHVTAYYKNNNGLMILERVCEAVPVHDRP